MDGSLTALNASLEFLLAIQLGRVAFMEIPSTAMTPCLIIAGRGFIEEKLEGGPPFSPVPHLQSGSSARSTVCVHTSDQPRGRCHDSLLEPTCILIGRGDYRLNVIVIHILTGMAYYLLLLNAIAFWANVSWLARLLMTLIMCFPNATTVPD